MCLWLCMPCSLLREGSRKTSFPWPRSGRSIAGSSRGRPSIQATSYSGPSAPPHPAVWSPNGASSASLRGGGDGTLPGPTRGDKSPGWVRCVSGPVPTLAGRCAGMHCLTSEPGSLHLCAQLPGTQDRLGPSVHTVKGVRWPPSLNCLCFLGPSLQFRDSELRTFLSSKCTEKPGQHQFFFLCAEPDSFFETGF